LTKPRNPRRPRLRHAGGQEEEASRAAGVGWQEPLEQRGWPPVVVANRTPAGGPAPAKSRRGCRWLSRSAVTHRLTTLAAKRREAARSSPRRPKELKKRRGKARPDAPTARVDRYATYRLGGMRDPPSAQQAAMNKCLAQSNKSSGRAETTKGEPTECPYVEYSENRGLNRLRGTSRPLCRA